MAKYDYWRTELGLGRIEEFCENGLDDGELARAMEITDRTLRDWKKRFPEIPQAITRGRGGARVQIKNALFERAKGGYRTVKKPMKRRIREYDETTGRCIREEEIIDLAEETIYIPPDTNAIKFWLTNRDPEHWQNRVELQGTGQLSLEEVLPDG